MLRKISFYNAPRKDFPNKTYLKQCLLDALLRLGFRLSSLQYTFTDDEELRSMNVKYLGHDYYTDILTFDLSDHEGEIEGDVYISCDRVRENAETARVKTEEEFCRVIAHGLLHLCGMKDDSQTSKEKMRESENAFIKEFFKRQNEGTN